MGGAQLVRRVVDEAHLLELGLLHLAQKPVERHFDAAQVGVAGGDVGGVHIGGVDGVFERLHLVGRHRAGTQRVVGRGRAHRLGHEGQVVERLETPADAPRREHAVAQRHKLAGRHHTENHGNERIEARERKGVVHASEAELIGDVQHAVGALHKAGMHERRVEDAPGVAEGLLGQRLVALDDEGGCKRGKKHEVEGYERAELARPEVPGQAARDGAREL